MKIRHWMQTSLKNRLTMAMGVMLLPLVLLTASFLYTYHSIIGPLNEVIRESREEDEIVMELNIMVLKAGVILNDYIAGKPGAREQFLHLSEELDKDFNNITVLNFDDPDELDLIKSAQQEWQQASARAQTILAVPPPIGRTPERRQDQQAFYDHIYQADKILKRIYKMIDEQINQGLTKAHAAKRSALIIMTLVLGLGLVGTFLVGSASARSIILPLRALEAGAARFGEGDFSHRVTLQRKDELEQLATAFNAMAEKIDQQIRQRQQLEAEQDQLILQLQNALETVKKLGGLLPICSACKKIRDDQGYWQQVEVYIKEHSEAEFTHGMCPECLKKLYPELNQNCKK